MKVNRKNFVVFINEKQVIRYFLWYEEKDLQEIAQHFEFALKNKGFPLEYIFNYLEHNCEYHIHKTASRKMLGGLRETILYAMNQDTWQLVEGCLNISSLSVEVSDLILKIDGEYVVPRDKMFEELKQYYCHLNNN